MPRVEAIRGAVSRVPTRCPFTRVAIKRRGVQTQPCNNCECVTFARVDGDPFTGTALAVAAKLRRTHRRVNQTSCSEHIGDRAGTIVTVILKRFVTAAVTIRLRPKLIPSPNRAFYWNRCTLGRGGFPRSKARTFTRHNRSGGRKKIRRGG